MGSAPSWAAAAPGLGSSSGSSHRPSSRLSSNRPGPGAQRAFSPAWLLGDWTRSCVYSPNKPELKKLTGQHEETQPVFRPRRPRDTPQLPSVCGRPPTLGPRSPAHTGTAVRSPEPGQAPVCPGPRAWSSFPLLLTCPVGDSRHGNAGGQGPGQGRGSASPGIAGSHGEAHTREKTLLFLYPNTHI